MSAFSRAWGEQVAATAGYLAAAFAPPDAEIKKVWLWYRRFGRLIIRWRRRII